jgi:hypothetical protein
VILRVVAVLAGGLVLGSGLAALPWSANDPCLGGTPRTQLVPYGTECRTAGSAEAGPEADEDLVPGMPALLAWIAVSALVLAAAARPGAPPTLTGAAAALAVLGLLGLLAHQGDVIAAVAGAAVLGVPLAALITRALTLALVLPAAVVVAWVPAGFADLHPAGVVLAAAVGAALAAGARRLRLP